MSKTSSQSKSDKIFATETSDHSCDGVCKQFQIHPRRKVCKECKLPWECHSLTENDTRKIQETMKLLRGEDPRSNRDYAWIPPKCPENRIEDYFNCFPNKEVPKHNSEGIDWRYHTLRKQIPEADISVSASRFVEPSMSQELENTVKNLKENSLHFGYVKEWSKEMPMQCPTCLKLLAEKELVVIPVQDSSTVYHPACFICCTCRQHLADLANCFREDGKLYCVRHFSEVDKYRCKACDELIYSEKFRQAGNAHYHIDHLRCCNCEELLEQNSYDHDGELHCIKCYEELHGNACDKCKQLIHLDTRHIEYEGKFWHTKCFQCELCGEVITEFEDVDGKLYCMKCFDDHIASKCAACNKVIGNSEKFIKFEEKEFHIDCFKCKVCKKVLTTGKGTFQTHAGIAYCNECHSRHFAVRCFRCKNPITGEDSIMYNKEPYHEGCFTCNKCHTRLGKQMFKVVEDDMYCTHCYGEIFCKKCHACDQPIYIGENDVTYSYGEIKWHPECFVCRVCKRSLENTPFAMQGKTLICKACTSQEDTHSAEVSKGPPDHHRSATSGSSESHHKCLNTGSSENRRLTANASTSSKDSVGAKKSTSTNQENQTKRSNEKQTKSSNEKQTKRSNEKQTKRSNEKQDKSRN